MKKEKTKKLPWKDNPNPSKTILIIDDGATFEGDIAEWENIYGGIHYSYSSTGKFINEQAAIQKIIEVMHRMYGICKIEIQESNLPKKVINKIHVDNTTVILKLPAAQAKQLLQALVIITPEHTSPNSRSWREAHNIAQYIGKEINKQTKCLTYASESGLD